MPEKITAGAVHSAAKTNQKADPSRPSEVRPHPADSQAQLLSQQRAVGNQAVQRLVKSGSLNRKRTSSPQRGYPDTESGQIQPSIPLQREPEQAKARASVMPDKGETAKALANSGASNIQRAWYNFDIPGTDYQFDPSITGIKTAAGIVKEKAVEGLEWILDEIKALVNAGLEWLSEKWTSLQELARSGFEAVKDSFFKIIGVIKSPLSFVANAVMNFDADSLAKGWASFTGIVSSLSKGFQTAVGNLVQQVSGVWGTISGYAGSLLGKIAGLTQNLVFKRLPDALQRVAHSLIARVQSLWKSIQEGWKRLFGAIRAWIDSALETILAFARRIASFGILAVIEGIRQFGKLVLFIKELLTNPQKYLQIMARKGVQALEGLEGRFSGIVGQHFGASRKAAPATGAAGAIQRQPAAAGTEAKRSASWSEIGSGILEMMGKKWEEFKSNPLAVVTALLLDMIFPILGNVKDVIQLFKDIKKVVAAPLSAGSLEELWTSILQLLDIPIMIYHTVVSILMRTLMLPLIVASFIPHPVVKGVAAAVGYALLAAFVQAELLNVGHKVLLLKTGVTTKEQKDEAYNRVADSFLAMAMTAVIIVVMLILHFMANVVKGIYNFVKGKVFPAEAAPVEGKGGVGESKGKGAPEESKPAEAKTEGIASKDGKRKIRMNEKGKCEVCASPCDELRRKYGSVMTPEAEAKIKLVEDDPALTNAMKEEALKPVEQELADLLAEKIASVKGPYSNIADGTKVEPGRDFQPQQKKKILAQNIENNKGVPRSDNKSDPWFGKDLVPPPKGPFEPGKFPEVPPNQAQVDHIVPRIGPDGEPLGSNAYSNAEVVSAEYNNMKRNKMK